MKYYIVFFQSQSSSVRDIEIVDICSFDNEDARQQCINNWEADKICCEANYYKIYNEVY